MTSLPKSTNYKKREIRHQTIYSRSLITRSIVVPINSIGKNIKDVLAKTISNQIEGKCVVEGYVKPDSTKLITYSSGLVEVSVMRTPPLTACSFSNLWLAKNINRKSVDIISSPLFPTSIILLLLFHSNIVTIT